MHPPVFIRKKGMLFALNLMVLFLVLPRTSSAQYYEHAVGFRAGTSFEASYKRFVFFEPKIQQAVEGLIGYHLDAWDKKNNGFVIEGLYMVHLDLGFNTQFSGFAGGGAYMGIYTETGKPIFFGGGFTLVTGVSYTFTHVPVSLSLDWKPLFGYPLRLPFSLARGGLTIRYVFPKKWH